MAAIKVRVANDRETLRIVAERGGIRLAIGARRDVLLTRAEAGAVAEAINRVAPVRTERRTGPATVRTRT